MSLREGGREGEEGWMERGREGERGERKREKGQLLHEVLEVNIVRLCFYRQTNFGIVGKGPKPKGKR